MCNTKTHQTKKWIKTNIIWKKTIKAKWNKLQSKTKNNNLLTHTVSKPSENKCDFKGDLKMTIEKPA